MALEKTVALSGHFLQGRWGQNGEGLRKPVTQSPHPCTSCQGHILSTRPIAVDVDLGHLADVVFVRFLHHNVALSPFPHCALGKEVPLCDHTPAWRVMLPLLEGEAST